MSGGKLEVGPRGSECVFALLYIFIVLLYLIFGAAVFLVIEGPNERLLKAKYQTFCDTERRALEERVNGSAGAREVGAAINHLDHCYRRRANEIKPLSHTMDNFFNSLVYSVGVFTTIGYGVTTASTRAGIIFTILYAIMGIPLYFGLHEHLSGRLYFAYIDFYHYLSRLRLRVSVHSYLRKIKKGTSRGDELQQQKLRLRRLIAQCRQPPPQVTMRMTFPAVALSVAFIAFVAAIFLPVNYGPSWHILEQFYFFFQSVSLIGFGDYYPSHSWQGALSLVAILPTTTIATLCILPLQYQIQRTLLRFSHWLCFKAETCCKEKNDNDGVPSLMGQRMSSSEMLLPEGDPPPPHAGGDENSAVTQPAYTTFRPKSPRPTTPTARTFSILKKSKASNPSLVRLRQYKRVVEKQRSHKSGSKGKSAGSKRKKRRPTSSPRSSGPDYVGGKSGLRRVSDVSLTKRSAQGLRRVSDVSLTKKSAMTLPVDSDDLTQDYVTTSPQAADTPSVSTRSRKILEKPPEQPHRENPMDWRRGGAAYVGSIRSIMR